MARERASPLGDPAPPGEPLPEDGESPLAWPYELEELLEAPTDTPEGPTETPEPPPPPVEIDGTGPTCGVCTDEGLRDATEPDPPEPRDGGEGVLTEGV